jgi:hypothetical protein
VTVVVVGTVVVVVVVVAGGRVVVVVVRGRVVVVVGGRVVVVGVPREVVPGGEPSLVVVEPSSGFVVEVLEVELDVDDDVVELRPSSVVSLVELVDDSTWVPSTSTGCFPASSGRTPASITTAAAHPASTHQNHRPSRARCIPRTLPKAQL